MSGSQAFAATHPHHTAFAPIIHVAQSDTSSGDDAEVSTENVEKYIRTYKAMQSNHSLTIDQATAQQGLSVSEFRAIEARIERDDALRERVRKALRSSASTTPEK